MEEESAVGCAGLRREYIVEAQAADGAAGQAAVGTGEPGAVGRRAASLLQPDGKGSKGRLGGGRIEVAIVQSGVLEARTRV